MMDLKERPVYVRFEMRSIEDRAASVKEGQYVGRDVSYALITPPGGNLVVEREAEDWLKSKTSDQFYKHYQESYRAWKDGEAEPEMGTSIRAWPVASPTQIASCIAANIKTVEDLATAPAPALQRIGMGSVGLQQKAIAWLQSANDHGKTAEELVTLRRDKEALEARVSELARQVEGLLTLNGGKPPKTRARETKDIEIV